MEKVTLIIGDHRWVGPADYFGDAYITEHGGLRIVFTISDHTLQNACIDFEPVMGLLCDTVKMGIFRANDIQNQKHIDRFEDLLSRNKRWKKRIFYMGHEPIRYKLKRSST